jgi:hypothetical protein
LKKAPPMVGFPLLLIPLAIYNIVVWLMPTVSLTDALVRLPLPSGAEWPITLSDLLLTVGLLLLLLEIAKGARPGSKYLTDHLLSLILFAAAAAEFVLWPKFGNSTYFLLALMTMVDFLGGLVLRSARPAPAKVAKTSRRASSPVETSAGPEPRIEPASGQRIEPTVGPMPPAASVAESVLVDHPRPKGAEAQSASEPSPALQPGSASPDTPQR